MKTSSFPALAGLISWLACGLLSPLLAAILYVDPAGSAPNDGSSWAAAYTDLQSALNAAADGDQIRIAQGTYIPTGARSISFTISKSLVIYGGYPSGGGARDPQAFPTILSGDKGVIGTATDNAYHVVQVDDGNALTFKDVRLDGLTVTAGYADWNTQNNHQGAGIDCSENLTLQDVSVSDNYSLGFGAAMVVRIGTSTLGNCLFSNNQAEGTGGGGAIRVGNTTSSIATLIATDCSFVGNAAINSVGDGGAIYLNTSTVSNLTNCSFTNNSAADLAGAINVLTSSATITNCTFQGNSAASGGAIRNQSASTTLTNCTFQGNKASSAGGAIYNDSSTPALTNCIIWNNVENGVTNAGGSSVANVLSTPTYTHCLVENLNPAGTGNLDGTSAANDPLFVQEVDPLTAPATAAGDLRLTQNSPAIDAGDGISGASANTEVLDLSGSPRFIDGPDAGDTVTTATIDLGAYERSRGLIYVNTAASGANSGRSWTDAYTDLQDALAVAAPGDQIWIAQGTYTPDQGNGQTAGDRTATFQLKTGVALYGGFAGGETALSQRNPATNPTTLSGDLDGNDNSGGDNSENAYHVLIGSGTTATAVVDGFTVTAGNANGAAPSNSGGALYNNGGSPSLTNCTLSGNSATIGGAIHNDNRSSPPLTNCTLSGNSASGNGGAIYNSNTSSPTLTNCTLSGNSAGNLGGAISGINRSSTTLTNCIIWNNRAAGATTTTSASEHKTTNATISYSHCIIANSGGSGGWMLVGTDDGNNLDADPLFITPADPAAAPSTAGDLRLTSGSRAIDAGSETAYVAAGGNTSDLDLSGNDRFVDDLATSDTGTGSPSCLDLGAYEANDLNSPTIQTFTLTTADTTDAGTLEFALSFDEDVYGLVDLSDLDITTTGTAAYTGGTIIGTGTTYTITLTGVSGEGTFSIAIRTDSGVTDRWSNAMSANTGIQQVTRFSAGSPIHYVRKDNPGAAAPYDTWANAAAVLQDALAFAVAGDQIWVAAGTYLPSERLDPNDARSVTFQLKTGVALYGGFSGGETELTERDPATHLTLLSGDLGSNDRGGDNTENAYHVLTGSGTDASALLDGFTITAGNANGGAERNRGGALYNDSSSPTLTNCAFSGNSAKSVGGAIYNTNSSPTFSNCLFSGNSTSTTNSIGGGAIFNTNSSSPTLTNCSLSGNHTGAEGGAIYNKNDSSPTLTNCILWNNQAASDPNTTAASVFNNAAYPSYSHCIIANSGGSGAWDAVIGIDGGDNLDADPLFVSGSDLRLTFGSPAIDTANYTIYFVNAGTSTDLDGKARFVDDLSTADTGTGTPSYLDLGAYELSDSSNPGLVGITLDTADTTNATELQFTATFDEVIVGLDSIDDLTITTTGTAAYTGGTITGSGSSYTITLTGVSGEGNFSIAIKTDSGVTDQWGNALSANTGIQGVSRISTRHYVKAANSGAAAPYDTWATAASDLQDALAVAAPGDQIWVLAGTYTPDQGTGQTAGDRNATFQLVTGIALYGGFTGIETALNERDPATHLTILSGDLLDNDSGGTNNAENAYHVLTGSGTDATAIVDGFKITAGNASGSSGGALYNSGGSPTLTNCTLSGNSAGDGGAIYNYSASSPTLTNCTLSGNSAGTNGGAIYNDVNSAPNLTNCRLTGNRADSVGGAIFNRDGSHPTLTNCTLSGNFVGYSGGGIYNHSSSYPTLRNCILWNNRAAGAANTTAASVFNNAAYPSYSHCIIANSGGSGAWVAALGTDNGNNLDADPLFVSGSNLRLTSGSPAIDAGSQTAYAAAGGILTDLDLSGNARFVDSLTTPDTGTGTPSYLDLGAYELSDSSKPGLLSFTLDTADTVNATELQFTATFDEDVIGLDSADDLTITWTGTVSHAGVTITGFGSSYTITLTGVSGEGDFSIAIKTNSVTDQWGNEMSEVNTGIQEVTRISTRHFVKKNNAGAAAPYDSWATAATDLQDALAVAAPGDQIWVVTGTYYPDQGTGDQTATFQLASGVALYGGFSGTESALSERNPDSNGTVLSGNIFGDNTANSFHVVTGSGTDATAILDGFTVTGGNASGTNTSDKSGGGLFIISGSPTLNNCIFENNSSFYYGGAIYLENASPTITDCSFIGNEAVDQDGGAISMDNSSPVITRCLFSNNTAYQYGGALTINFSSAPVLTNCSLIGNSAWYGGSFDAYDLSAPVLVNCVISGNSAFYDGGALYSESSTPSLINCTITGNSATEDNGGAIYTFDTSAPSFSNCIIWNNREGIGSTSPGASVHNFSGSDVSNFNHCLVQNFTASTLNASGSGGSGNLDGTDLNNDPLFLIPVDPTTAPTSGGDLRLQEGSPALDAGDGTANNETLDLTGNLRIQGTTIDLGAFEGIANYVPIFPGYAVSTPYETPVSVSIVKTLAKASDPDGDPLSLTAAGTSTQGGTIVQGGSAVTYTPANGFSGTDTFSVTISDDRGASVIGNITVSVGPSDDSTTGGQGVNAPEITMLEGGNVDIRFQGIPGRSYEIQRSIDGLETWQALTTVVATANGSVTFVDQPGTPSAFYRFRKP